mmetsp:Transcript_7251/g.21158  ORF Transcript_7251/g.21158 Transcript_7251/m.21158 type:complete len:206 (-) Transcript_7251:300-917(-)
MDLSQLWHRDDLSQLASDQRVYAQKQDRPLAHEFEERERVELLSLIVRCEKRPLHDGLDTPQHGRGDEKQKTHDAPIELTTHAHHDTTTHGHHRRVGKRSVLLIRDAFGEEECDEGRGCAHHLREGHVDILQSHVPAEDGEAKGERELAHIGQRFRRRIQSRIRGQARAEAQRAHHIAAGHVYGCQCGGQLKVVHRDYPFVHRRD